MERFRKYLFVVAIVGLLAVFTFARMPYAPQPDAEGVKQGVVLMSSQVAWQVLDTTSSSGTEPTDPAVDERTYDTLTTAITTASSGDDEISYAHIPPTWNGLRFRCIGITNNGTTTYQIYLGTLAGGTDCILVNAGQLAFTVGQQVSDTSTYELADAVTITAKDWENQST